MTSKSPDTPSTDDGFTDGESTASTNKVGAGDSSRTGSSQTEALSQLRSAISEIDQRHAEGETGFFAGLSGLDDDDIAGRARSGASTTSRRKKKTNSGKRPRPEPDNGWVEGGTGSIPDFVDGPDFLGSDDAGADLAAGPGLSFDEDEDDAPDFDADYAQAKKTAMNMLAMRDHSSDELRKKLLKRDLMPESIEVLIEKLQNSRLLNDEEFAHRFARAQRENRKLSRSVLKRELSKKGISPELASDAVADIDGEEELAREVAEKKAASTRRLDYAVRERRILGMLARRGFPSAICIKVTREVLADD
ncbi:MULTISPECIES: regulatory protein RecX [unclassified Brevibacterium]|uniref:regulatory protein RecX n=1 Tax=unclassified Brevibacterium TaxID=2614124 RepID=UPI0010931CC5|nr:regulatory protein RecX [Brevibacterium sp. S22]TGD30722.1 regulatory protein RecX [Brevibacterium sp. S22]